ncbi:MAG TPA: DNA repair protein RadC, partial [Bacillus sp. (in: firmicutes)]|nr:DNA repair protein RadC [Bacillus sp. (in: firmicutes)]
MQVNLYQENPKTFLQVARENVSFYGPTESSIQDLLTVIIGKSATPEVCSQLAALSVRELMAMRVHDFKQLGMSKTLAERLEACMGLTKVLNAQSIPADYVIRCSEDAYGYFEFLRHEQQEQFVVAFLDTKNKVIGRKVIFVGTLNSSVVHPREIYSEALKRSAASIIVSHQHPSGDPCPSREDIDVTKRLKEVGEVIGIILLDHIVVGDGRYISLKEKGYM